MTTSCQLLIDNRKTGKTSVVVVPADEWYELRGKQMQPVRRPTPIPIVGSQAIQFSNRANSQLAGCSSTGIIEVFHTGTVEEAVIILKNQAYRLNTNILVPLSMYQNDADPVALPNIEIEAQMMKCPVKLARGN
jgi:hypothetical protein